MIVPASALPYLRMQRTGLCDPARDFAAIIHAEAAQMERWLPPRAKSILDLGCGIAGVDAALWERLERPTLHLVDRTERGSPRYGFGDRTFYNSLNVARELLTANGVDAGAVVTHEAPPDWSAVGTVDVALSLLSWGFHYPVSTYLDAVAGALAPGGVLVLDVRRGTGGREEIEKRFSVVGVLIDDAKRERLVCRPR